MPSAHMHIIIKIKPLSMTEPRKKTVGVVLSGGQSSRMGKDKSTLLYKGRSLLDHMHHQLEKAGIQNIITVGQSAGKNSIPDIVSGRGPLSGIHAALEYVNADTECLLIVPIDMPLLEPSILKTLIKSKTDHDAVYFEHFILPLRLSASSTIKNIVSQLIHQPITQKTSIKVLLSQITNLRLPLEKIPEDAFYNTSTPEDWYRITGKAL